MQLVSVLVMQKHLLSLHQKPVKEGIAKADAESLKKEIEEAGGKVTLK